MTFIMRSRKPFFGWKINIPAITVPVWIPFIFCFLLLLRLQIQQIQNILWISFLSHLSICIIISLLFIPTSLWRYSCPQQICQPRWYWKRKDRKDTCMLGQQACAKLPYACWSSYLRTCIHSLENFCWYLSSFRPCCSYSECFRYNSHLFYPMVFMYYCYNVWFY